MLNPFCTVFIIIKGIVDIIYINYAPKNKNKQFTHC